MAETGKDAVTRDRSPRDAQTCPSSQTNGELSVFDTAGRRVCTLASGRFGSEPRDVRWDGRAANGAPVASGVYFMRLSSSAGYSTVERFASATQPALAPCAAFP